MSEIPAALTAALSGEYDLERELGEGGMATVYLATDAKHQRQVAVKVLKPEIASTVGGERFLQEIRTTANLRHPHIVPLFDSGASDGFLYYVMPFIEGESLQERLERDVQLSIDESLRLTQEIAGALAYAHDRGVIHRDIKPGNIMLEAGHAVVGMGRYAMGDYEDAVSSADAATELQVDFPLALIFGGLSLARLGGHAEGIARLEKGVEMTRRIPIFVGMLGYARSLGGDPDGARALLAEIEDRGRTEYVSPIAAVLLEMSLGDSDALEAALRVALDDRMPPITMSLLPPDHVAELGRSPRFAELFRELRLPAYMDGGA